MPKLQFSNRGKLFVQEILVISIIAFLILFIGYTHAIIDYSILVFAAALWTLLGILWILFGQKAETPFKLPLLIWVGTYALIVLFSIDPRRSAGEMLIMSASIFLFLLVYDLVWRGWPAKLFIHGLLIVSSIITFAGIFDFFKWYRNWLLINPTEWLTSITFRPAAANVLAPFNYFAALFALYFLYSCQKKLSKTVFFIIFLASNAMLFITSSRGGWLGAAVGYGILLVLIGIREKDRLRIFWTYLSNHRILLIAGLLVTGAFLFAAIMILYRQAIHPTHGSILNSRKLFWQIAWSTFLRNPILGQGPFTYGTAFLKGTSVPPDLVWVHAHNSYLNLLAEMGISGLIAFLVLALAFLRDFVSKLKLTFNKESTFMIPAAGFLGAFAIHTFFDSLHMEPAILWTLVILMAAVVTPIHQTMPDGKKISRRRNIWVLIPLLAAWVGVWMITPYHAGVSLANQTQWQLAKIQFQTAINRDPGSALAHQQLALVDSVLAATGNSEHMAEAIKELERTIEIEPGWALNHANLAALLAAQGNLSQAQIEAETATALAPRVSLYQLNLGNIAEKNQDQQSAEMAYTNTLDLDSSWSHTSFWSESPLRQDVQQTRLGNSTATQPISLSDAEAALAKNPQSTWAYNQLASIYIAEGNFAQAQNLLDNATLAYSSSMLESVTTNWLKAELLAAQGMQNEAVTMGEQAIASYQSYGIYGPGSFGLLYYAPRMFRMPAMALEIVPQMVKPPTPQIWVEREELLHEWLENK